MSNTRPSYLDGNHLFVDPDAAQLLRTVNVTTAATQTMTENDSFNVTVATKSSATQTFTLPKASTVPGAQYTFICGHASGEINLAVDAADSIVGLTFAAIGADADTGNISTTAGSGVKNTAATNVIGDGITLISDGVLTYFIQGVANGIWASLG